MKRLFPSLASIAALTLASISAQDLTYDYGTNPGWFTAGAWTDTVPAATDWVGGANANIAVSSTKNILFSESTTIGNLTMTGTTGVAANLANSSPVTLTFSGGEINTSTVLQVGGSLPGTSAVSIQGNFTKTGIGFVRLLGDATSAAYAGTATVNAGRFEGIATSLGVNTNVTVNSSATFQLRNAGTYSLGTIAVDGGTFELSRNNTNSATIAATVNSLSGTSGGNVIVVVRSTNVAGTHNVTLNVNQAVNVNTTYNGSITGYSVNSFGNNEGFLTLNKQGAGSLTLGGTIDLRRQTTVSGGTLLVNSSSATFTSDGTTAISVDAILGGTGTLQITGGDNVLVGATGSLIAGLAGTADQTTFNLSGGSLDLSAATAGSATEWLNFDLGADTTAGSTYDQILLSGTGSLNIGSGLNFSDFNFNTLSGFGSGTYTLFATPSSITGSLGTATGLIGSLDATLEISGNNLVLTVVPEPSTTACLLGGFAVLLLSKRLRKRW